MKRRMARVLAMVMAVALMGTSTNLTAFAAENCEHHTHNDVCGYVQAQEGTPCSFVCDVCEAEVSDEEEEEIVCICTDKCSEETINAECPVCGVQDADLSVCIGEEEEAVTCTCGTDDPAIHATNCLAYVAPENPVCICAMKCSEDTLNVWCDICGEQGVSACQGEDTAVVYDDPVNSGNCGAQGDNVTWNFDSATGTLTISGTGAMKDMSDDDEGEDVQPWLDYHTTITKIVIEYGVTQIGENAFYNRNAIYNVEEVIFKRNENGESSVELIKNSAFRECRNLNEIVIPASVVTIEDNAFRNNDGLTTIEFEEGSNLTTLGRYCFYASHVSEWILPSKVRTIGRMAFASITGSSSINTFYFPSGEPFAAGDSVFYRTDTLKYFGEYTVNGTDKTCSISYIGVGQNGDNYYPDENANGQLSATEIVIPEKIDGYKVVEAKIGDTIIYKYTEPHPDDGNDNNTSEETKELKETEEQIFTRELLTKVAGAKAGDNVVIDATIWHSFSAKVLEQLFAKEGVSYTIYYYFKGEYFYITIPANAALEEGCDWYGPLKLNAMFGRTMITKAEYEEAIAKLQEQAK